jgi:tRNA-2-methylthio-N6-dimethylallyladenosine synthase
MNRSDSERIASYLEQNSCTAVSEIKEADLVILNTCGVRQSAEDRVYGLVPKIEKENSEAKIVLTGCLSKRRDVQKRLQDKIDVWLSIQDLPSLLDELIGKNTVQMSDGNEYLRIEPELTSSFSVYIPIGNGCNNYCTYCVVPYARGREVYRPALEVLMETEKIINKGYKEINLIAQNVNSYSSQSSDIEEYKKYFQGDCQKIDFADLLEAVAGLEGDFWIRFATSHPKDMNDKLIKVIAENKNVCRHIHLPAQAGDNEVLTRMNRKYSIEHYKELIKKIRQYIPDCSITTDIIVGFPGETREQFKNTAQLFQEVKFDMAYISQYSPRPGTGAAQLKDNVSTEEKKKREEALMEILRKTAYENNKKYLEEKARVLLEGKNKKKEWYGKTDTNKNVQIFSDKGKELKVGEFVDVVIKDIQDFGLRGSLL